MEYIANLAIGISITIIGWLAAVMLDEKLYVPIGLIGAIALVIWRISSKWTNFSDRFDALERLMKSRPCIKVNDCEFINNVGETKKQP